jgi:hypothetical protein
MVHPTAREVRRQRGLTRGQIQAQARRVSTILVVGPTGGDALGQTLDTPGHVVDEGPRGARKARLTREASRHDARVRALAVAGGGRGRRGRQQQHGEQRKDRPTWPSGIGVVEKHTSVVPFHAMKGRR